jgi:hypothetical protein
LGDPLAETPYQIDANLSLPVKLGMVVEANRFLKQKVFSPVTDELLPKSSFNNDHNFIPTAMASKFLSGSQHMSLNPGNLKPSIEWANYAITSTRILRTPISFLLLVSLAVALGMKYFQPNKILSQIEEKRLNKTQETVDKSNPKLNNFNSDYDNTDFELALNMIKVRVEDVTVTRSDSY